jgi:hypothetical protein
VNTTWGTLTTRHPVYVPFGRLGDFIQKIGPDAASRCTLTHGRALGEDCRVNLFGSVAAASVAISMGARPLVRVKS